MYATQADMENRFGTDELIQLTDPNRTAIDATVLDQALTDASAEIDLYLARFNPPLLTNPPMLVVLCCDIARYRLFDDAATEQVSKRYDDAISKLTAISTGKIQLGLPDSTPAVADAPEVSAPTRVWSQDTLRDYS